MGFNEELFQKQIFDASTVKKFLREAEVDLGLAYQNSEPRAQFWFVYSSFLRCGMALMATRGYRVRSKEGHHIFIIQKIAEILNDSSILDAGDYMRKKRNKDAYREIVSPTEEEISRYLNFVSDIYKRTEYYISKQEHLF